MNSFKLLIPKALIYSRLLIAAVIAALTILNVPNLATWITALMIIGLLTDIFDGIIARQLGISTKKLRVLDSNVDQVFWLITIACVFYLNWAFIETHIWLIAAVIVLEGSCYLISYLRFRRTVASHTILAKAWALSLIVFLIDLVQTGDGFITFAICISLGVLSRIEISLILLKLKKWTTDVPSIFSVRKLNEGIPLNRKKLFNG